MSRQSLTPDKPFLFIFHRGANSSAKYEKALSQWNRFHDATRDQSLSRNINWCVEGDINWLCDGNRILLYFWHPNRVGQTFSSVRELLRMEKADKMILLDDLIAREQLSPYYIIEIKSGVGSGKKALENLISTIRDAGLSKRVCFDSYSPDTLTMIKQINPDARTSLHTSLVINNRILITPATKNIIQSVTDTAWNSLSRLHQVDTITTFIRPTAKGSRNMVQLLREHEKSTFFGALMTRSMFRNAWQSGAGGGYIRFKLESLPKDWLLDHGESSCPDANTSYPAQNTMRPNQSSSNE